MILDHKLIFDLREWYRQCSTPGPSELNMDQCCTDDKVETIFCEISGFRNLTQFDAPFTQLTSKCAKYLVNLPKLKSVNLAHSRFYIQNYFNTELTPGLLQKKV